MLTDKEEQDIIVALRNEKGSYNLTKIKTNLILIVALRNEKGSYNSSKTVVSGA